MDKLDLFYSDFELWEEKCEKVFRWEINGNLSIRFVLHFTQLWFYYITQNILNLTYGLNCEIESITLMIAIEIVIEDCCDKLFFTQHF